MDLQKITIRGFKSIQSLNQLELMPINLLIGGNGAGKSNLIEFFKMLRAMMGLRLAEFKNERPSLSKFLGTKGGIDNFLYGGVQQTSEISAEFMFNSGKNGYRFSVGPTADGGFSIREEASYYAGWNRPESWWVESPAEFRTESVLPKRAAESKEEEKDTRQRYIYDAISSWQIYQFHDTSQFSGARQPSFVRDGFEFFFDGANLSAFLYSLKNHALVNVSEEDSECAYGNIVDLIRVAAPYFDDFVLEPYKEGQDVKVKLQWRQRDMLMNLQPHHISDGTLRFMCLATVMLQPTPPKLIIVDEPELGLHPEALEALAETIRRCSEKTQFILATQSPAFADYFAPEEVLTVNRINGASVFERQSSTVLGKWLEEYSVGQLWRKNIIRGGVK